MAASVRELPRAKWRATTAAVRPLRERRRREVIAEHPVHAHAAPPLERAVGHVARQRVAHVDDIHLQIAEATGAESGDGVGGLRLAHRIEIALGQRSARER